MSVQTVRPTLGARAWFVTGGHVDGHFEVDRDAEFVFWKGIDAYDLGEILRSHGIVRGSVGEGHEDAHAFVVFYAPSNKVYAVF